VLRAKHQLVRKGLVIRACHGVSLTTKRAGSSAGFTKEIKLDTVTKEVSGSLHTHKT